MKQPKTTGNEPDAVQQVQRGQVGDNATGIPSGAGSINLRQSGEANDWLPLVELEHPWQFKGAVALKSERIAFCPIQKVRTPQKPTCGIIFFQLFLLSLQNTSLANFK